MCCSATAAAASVPGSTLQVVDAGRCSEGRLPGLCDCRARAERAHFLNQPHSAAKLFHLHYDLGEHGGMSLQGSQSFFH